MSGNPTFLLEDPLGQNLTKGSRLLFSPSRSQNWFMGSREHFYITSQKEVRFLSRCTWPWFSWRCSLPTHLSCLPNSSETLQRELASVLLLGQRWNGGPMWFTDGSYSVYIFSFSTPFTFYIFNLGQLFLVQGRSVRNQYGTLTLKVSILVWQFGILCLFILVSPLKLHDIILFCYLESIWYVSNRFSVSLSIIFE